LPARLKFEGGSSSAAKVPDLSDNRKVTKVTELLSFDPEIAKGRDTAGDSISSRPIQLFGRSKEACLKTNKSAALQ
jgi:hypothetical protein